MDEITLLAKASHATVGGKSLYEVTLVTVCLFGPKIIYFAAKNMGSLCSLGNFYKAF